MKPPTPRIRKVAENRERVGLLLVHTGDGKGKTTSAFGVALRAAGQDMRVHVVQFIKGSREAGEVTALRRLGVPVERAGEGFTWEVRSDERQRELAAWGMERARAAVAAGGPGSPPGERPLDVLVLDEVNIALSKGFLDVDAFLGWRGSLPDELHVLCTGRGAPLALIEAADLVTEHRLVKHPFERGIKAQRGVEF
jgi:cob(I)alamin adenosyltransferase